MPCQQRLAVPQRRRVPPLTPRWVRARLEETIAKSPSVAMPFLTKLAKRLRPMAVKEMEELQGLKQEEEGTSDMMHWDTTCESAVAALLSTRL